MEFNVNIKSSIAELKMMIEEREGIRVREQRLFYKGKLLEDNKTLLDIDGSTFQLG